MTAYRFGHTRTTKYENDKYRVKKAKQSRLTKLEKTGSRHTREEVLKLFKLQKGLCYFCWKRLDDYHEDHLTPVEQNGTDWIDNIALTCSRCNLEKSNTNEKQYWNFLSKKYSTVWIEKRRKLADSNKRKKVTLAEKRRKDEEKNFLNKFKSVVSFSDKLNFNETYAEACKDIHALFPNLNVNIKRIKIKTNLPGVPPKWWTPG